nr:hypothetical protein [uncultured Cohaesibacter sp.]
MKIKLIPTAAALVLAGAVALPLSGFAHDNEVSSDQSSRFPGMGNSGHMMSMGSMMGNNGMMSSMMNDSESMTDMMSSMMAFMSSHMDEMLEMMGGNDSDNDLKRPSEPAQE